jgi:hypothetical protein
MRLFRLFLTLAIKMPSSPRSVTLALAALLVLSAHGSPGNTPWDEPATALTDQIAAILGPGQAHLTLRNLSTISNDELPSIRLLIEQDLRAHGIASSSDDAANLLRVTLSENAHERLWIAEIVEGSETKVVMVHVDLVRQPPNQRTSGITLHKQFIVASHEQILAVFETPASLVVLEPEQISIYAHTTSAWSRQSSVAIRQKRPLVRDPRGTLFASADGQGFDADLPGTHCEGTNDATVPAGQWTIHCHESDDPWPVAPASSMQPGSPPAPLLKAFYNSTRDYFTGIVAPSPGIDLPPFYDAAWLPRASTNALLINGVDGTLQLIESGTLKPIAGGRDWGSDFAALQSACGSGTQVVASGSGSAAQDSLRAYEIPALEAIPASTPLPLDGSVTAVWTAPGGKSIFVVVRSSPLAGQPVQYEVDRVTATCN